MIFFLKKIDLLIEITIGTNEVTIGTEKPEQKFMMVFDTGKFKNFMMTFDAAKYHKLPLIEPLPIINPLLRNFEKSLTTNINVPDHFWILIFLNAISTGPLRNAQRQPTRGGPMLSIQPLK